MTTRISKTLTACTLAALVSVACIRDDRSFEQVCNQGMLELSSMTMDFEQAVEIDATRAGQINTENFTIAVYDAENTLRGSWILAQLPDIITLPVGSYTLKISSGEAAAAAWDAPCYGAERAFSIEKDETTSLGTVTCSMTNIMVSVVYSDYMLSKMDDDCKVTVTLGTGSLVFAKGEKRIGYFRADREDNTMTAEFSGTIDGQFYAETAVFDAVKAAQHRKLKYSIKENPDPDTPQGGADFKFTVDVTQQIITIGKNIDVTEDVIPDPDDDKKPAEDKGKPIISWIGGNIDEQFTLTTTDTTEVKIPIDIDVPNGIAGFTVDIESTASAFSKESMQDLGLDTHIDFINPGSMKSALENDLNFKTGEDVAGQTHMLFNITTFVPLFVVANNETVDFTLTITDAAGNVAVKTLKLKIEL